MKLDVAGLVRRLIHPLAAEERRQVIDEVSASASAGFDYFLLVVLSCSIATLGLITDSPAVIIGAMLVAPLMSPIIGIGLASITGEVQLARNALSALLLGAGLAVLLSTVMAWINRLLPFVVLQELPGEVLARSRPSPIDLVIALAGGLAAAYAMTRSNLSAALPGVAIATALMPPLCTVGIGVALERWDVAGGATLLFLTNAITIAFAAGLVFFLRGLAPRRRAQDRRVTHTLGISALLVLALLIPLTYYSVRFFREASQNRLIDLVVREEVARLDSTELVELEVQRVGQRLDMVLVVRTNSGLRYEQVVGLQRAIVDRLGESVSLKVNQVFTDQLDPLIPPTPTRTPTITSSPTPGPSPTATASPTPQPTNTPTATPTPGLARAAWPSLPTLQLYQTPGGPVIGQVAIGQTVTLLYGRQVLDGLVWVEVVDSQGRQGWIPEIFLRQVTATSIP
jgi:uncharacterized hydrophobic protein (TIGR00271 family)